jgi:hypothetical protein
MNYFIDRFQTVHTSPTCPEFHAHGDHPNPNNTMPAIFIPMNSIYCADCND